MADDSTRVLYDYHCLCENADGHPPDDLWLPHTFLIFDVDPPIEAQAPVYEFYAKSARPNDDRPVFCPLCQSPCGALNDMGPGIVEALGDE